eukprot:1161699-Pelagomonas_calceolata.AAC.5
MDNRLHKKLEVREGGGGNLVSELALERTPSMEGVMYSWRPCSVDKSAWPPNLTSWCCSTHPRRLMVGSLLASMLIGQPCNQMFWLPQNKNPLKSCHPRKTSIEDVWAIPKTLLSPVVCFRLLCMRSGPCWRSEQKCWLRRMQRRRKHM